VERTKSKKKKLDPGKIVLSPAPSEPGLCEMKLPSTGTVRAVGGWKFFFPDGEKRRSGIPHSRGIGMNRGTSKHGFKVIF
jgi:hypothetical protein